MVDLGYTKPELATMFGVTVRTIERDLAKTKKNNDEQKFCDIAITGNHAAKAALNRCAEGATFGPQA